MLFQVIKVVGLANLTHALAPDELGKVVTSVYIRENWEAILHIGQKLTWDVVRFMTGVKRDNSRTTLGVEIWYFIGLDFAMEQDIIEPPRGRGPPECARLGSSSNEKETNVLSGLHPISEFYEGVQALRDSHITSVY